MRYPRLCKSLEYLVDHWGPLEGRTRLVKLIYLADRQWRRKQGKTYTEAHYYRWNHGPFAREVLAALEWLDGIEIIERERRSPGGTIYIYETGERSRLRDVKLDPDFRHTLSGVAEKWGKSSLQELLDFVYSRDDFKNVEFGERLLD